MSTTLDDLRAQVSALQQQLAAARREQPVAERDAIADAYARADAVARMFGDTASQPIPGESALRYRQRLIAQFQKHSPSFQHVRCDAIGADLIAVAEDQVYAAATAKASDPASYAPGQLVAIKSFENGREVTRYHGDPMGWMQSFMGGGGAVGYINRHPARA